MFLITESIVVLKIEISLFQRSLKISWIFIPVTTTSIVHTYFEKLLIFIPVHLNSFYSVSNIFPSCEVKCYTFGLKIFRLIFVSRKIEEESDKKSITSFETIKTEELLNINTTMCKLLSIFTSLTVRFKIFCYCRNV